MTPGDDNTECAKRAIAALASHCIDALAAANFAGREGMDEMCQSFRKLACMYADDAWSWVPQLRTGTIVRGNADLVPCTHGSLGGGA